MRGQRRGKSSRLRAAVLWASAAVLVLAACEDSQEPQDPGDSPGVPSAFRAWTIVKLANDDAMNSLADDNQQIGGVVDVVREIGTTVFTPDPDDDGIATVEVFSNETGETFWVSGQAPSPWGLASPDSTIGTRISFFSSWRFRKDTPDATFRLVITKVTVEVIDDNGIAPTPDQCRWSLYSDPNASVRNCFDMMRAAVLAHYWAYPDTLSLYPFFYASGGPDVVGFRNMFQFGLSVDPRLERRFFDLPDFAGVKEPGHMRMSLVAPVTVDVPLDTIPVGEVFETGVTLRAEAWTWRQGESYAAVFFRDPGGGDGISLEYEGLTLLPPPTRMREPIWDDAPAPACNAHAGGNGGIIQFDTTAYRSPEWSGGGARIAVTRSGGGAGAASAAFATGGGTATPGSDYETVTLHVRFADGETGTRVVPIPILADAEAEADETVGLTLSSPGGCAVLGGRTSAELTIMDDDQPPPDLTHTIGGTVTGLAGSGLVLTNNSTDDLAITADGPFAFAREYADGFVYNVRVHAQPSAPAQDCTVSNGGGTVAGADVTDIAVSCQTLPPGNGSLDPAFGSAGKVTLGVSYTGVQGDAPDVALQADGKLVVVSGNTLARYNADGSLDGSFGTGGVVTVDFYGASYDRLNAVGVQPNGRIVVAGYSKDGVNSSVQEDFIVARYEADGALDASFGAGGKVVTDFESHQDIAYDLAIQPDGKIVVVGLAAIDASGFGVYYPDFAAARYTRAGALDASFGTGGVATTNIAGQTDLAYAVALQADGKIVLAGRVAPSGGADPDIGVLRYNADGTLDLGFGTGGFVRNQTNIWDEAADVVVQADGRIVVVGFTLHVGGIVNPAPDTLTIERYDADGGYDATFGTGGRVQMALMSPGRAVALQPDGSIVVAGVEQSGASADYAIARFSAGGSLDASFGTNGMIQVDFFGDLDIANAIALQPDGKVVVVGSVRNGTQTQLGLIRTVPQP
jgi:uncharacterized delta-60 repeat protein